MSRGAEGRGDGFDRDEFYVGYESAAPRRTATFVRNVVLLLLLLSAAVGLALVSAQGPFAKSVFEFGQIRDFEGYLQAHPVPALRVPRPGGESFSVYPLVAFGKWGAEALVEGRDGQRVKLRGTLIYRGQETMIEVADGSLQPSEGASTPAGAPLSAAPVSFGQRTFVGEIVDSKCYLGVMKPSTEKPHRACAVRCISGGVPPVLLLRDSQGPAETLWLLGADGRAIGPEVLDMVADPLEITGELERHGSAWVLKAEPETFRLL